MAAKARKSGLTKGKRKRCQKIGHVTKKAATDHARQLPRIGRKNQHAYICMICKRLGKPYWHVGQRH